MKADQNDQSPSSPALLTRETGKIIVKRMRLGRDRPMCGQKRCRQESGCVGCNLGLNRMEGSRLLYFDY